MPSILIFIFAGMNLVIDIGNTNEKAAIFDKQKIVHVFAEKKISAGATDEWLQQFNPDACIIASVAQERKDLYGQLKEAMFCILLDAKTKIPIKNHYLTPATLGNDRLANAVAANYLFPQKNVLVIDAGTCLKIDFLTKGEYHGGSISPGLQMRYEALHHYTERLPLLKPVDSAALTGQDTSESIHSGVINGIRAELNGIIDQYKKINNDLQLILCGGDARFFSNHFKYNIFAAPYLTLQGLNEILIFNQ